MRALAPVRRPVPLRRGRSAEGRAQLKALLGVEQVSLFKSATQALQAVLTHCAANQSSLRNEVILPAYGCPDLLSACLGAGLKPRMVDILGDGWGYCQADLLAALSPATLAVVAVDLLGLGDESLRLRGLITDPDIALVQDSAQHLPRYPSTWSSDYQVFSFGRGKPLNLMGGGAATGVAQSHAVSGQGPVQRLIQSRAGALLFNAATHASLYGVASRLPGLGLGTTRYHLPENLTAPPPRLALQLATAIPTWRQCASYSITAWLPYMAAWEALGIRPLRAVHSVPTPTEPLRLALTAESPQLRDALVDALCSAGLGASRLYGRSLPQIDGVPAQFRGDGPYPAADRLAKHLFTLPTHAGVDERAAMMANLLIKRIAGTTR